MTKAFKHKGLKQLLETGESHHVAKDLQKRLIRQLDLLNAAKSIKDTNLPGYDLHRLKGNRKGT